MKSFQYNFKTAMLSLAMLCTLPAYSAGTQTVYEDAESGLSTNWTVYANASGMASIGNIHDMMRASRVITFNGDGKSDGYMLGALRGADMWNNTMEKNIRWSMNYSEDVSIYISLKTTNGKRSLKYTNVDSDYGLDRGHIHHGLGTDITDGTWRTFNRDLEADLAEFDPGNSIIAVNAFMVRGSGSIDDVVLYKNSVMPGCITYEDAEDELTNGWSVYANTSGTATIGNENDEDRDSRVITFNGDGKNDGYMLGALRGANMWNNMMAKKISWAMNYSEDVSIYISLKTTNGKRSLKYTNVDSDYGLDRGHIHHGLGTDITDGTWRTFNRDLEADLTEFDPGNSIIAVNAFMVRGSGSVDDIKLCPSVQNDNTAPIANAGQNQNVDESTSVELNGTASSDADGDSLTYLWTIVSKPNGSNVTLSDATIVNPVLVVDEIGTYTIQLVVNDGQVDSLVDTVILTANLTRDYTLESCGTWTEANSGGVSGTLDSWDISNIPTGATFDFEFEAYNVPDKFNVMYADIPDYHSGWRGSIQPSTGEALSGPGNLIENNLFTKGDSNTTNVQISGEQAGTVWWYRVKCTEHNEQ